jgi:hypothetical protein
MFNQNKRWKIKIILYTISLIAMAILLQSCATEPIFYHSEASLPYFHRSTKTVFRLIKDENATNEFQYGVIAAIDNDTLSYVLLAPSNQTLYVRELTDVNLNRAIPLLPYQVKEFIKILNSSADKWNSEFDSKDGINYEFTVAPENRIIPQSENVVNWYATFKFYFQNNDAGPLGSVIIGEGLLRNYYFIERLSAIKDLASMLGLAIK